MQIKKRTDAAELTRRESAICANRRIARHEYQEMIVKMSALLYMYAGCSLRSIPKALEVIDVFYRNDNDKLPVFTTVETWVKKLGLDTYKEKYDRLEDYCLIMDGSVVIGGQQMMVALGTSADAPQDGKALSYSDIKVLGMELKTCWNSNEVAEFTEKIIEQHGTPQYCLSDAGGNLRKAFREKGLPWHCDIGHSVATWLKNIYSENADYKLFENHLGATRKYALSSVAYLMPPKCRTKARWMNIFIPVKWAMQMLENSHKWSKTERYFYGFIQSDASIIEELYRVSELVNNILSICKCNGLSEETIAQAKQIAKDLMLISDCTRLLYVCIVEYLDREKTLLTEAHPIHNISSDCMESMFGYVKEKTGANRTTGFTTLSLIMPLKTKMGSIEACRTFDVVDGLRRTSVTDVESWRKSDFNSTFAIRKRMMTNREYARVS